VAEIKSTFELVMEKTRGITLSQKDREEQKNREIKLKIGRLLQKYQNRELRKDHMEREFNALKKVYGETAHDQVLYESIERINLDENFNLLEDFLKSFLGLELRQVEFILKDYRETLQNLTQETIVRLKEVLEKKHCISGSAVLPNVEGDNAWQAAAKEIKDRFSMQLSEEKERLKKFLSLPSIRERKPKTDRLYQN
jgi:hypothetical protein